MTIKKSTRACIMGSNLNLNFSKFFFVAFDENSTFDTWKHVLRELSGGYHENLSSHAGFHENPFPLLTHPTLKPPPQTVIYSTGEIAIIFFLTPNV